ncbi:MAG: hypothetical protein SGARI_006537 [Bacillariaceae sp.]
MLVAGGGPFACKTVRLELTRPPKKLDDYTLHISAVEAIASEKFHGSTTNIYGYCGMFFLTELGDEGDLQEYVARNRPMEPLQKLGLALDIARAISGFSGREALIHNDLETCNVVITQGKVKIIDFAEAVFLPQSTESNNTCHLREIFKISHGIEPPEMIRKSGNYSTKINSYTLGSLLFYILTEGARIYHCESPKRICNSYSKDQNTISKDDVRTLKSNGSLPLLPAAIEQSRGPVITVIRETMKRALHPNPERRPSAQEIVDSLERAQQTLDSPVKGLPEH